MDATHSPEASAPDLSPIGTETSVFGPLQDDEADVFARFEAHSPDGWSAVGTLGLDEKSGIYIRSIEVLPSQPAQHPGVTSTILRQIPTGAILAAANAYRTSFENLSATFPRVEHPRGPQPGRAPLTDAQLAEVAVRYLLETAPGKPRGAIQRIAKQMGKPPATISRWVMRARADGWLGPAVPGREGAEQGPKITIIAEGPADAALLRRLLNGEWANILYAGRDLKPIAE